MWVTKQLTVATYFPYYGKKLWKKHYVNQLLTVWLPIFPKVSNVLTRKECCVDFDLPSYKV